MKKIISLLLFFAVNICIFAQSYTTHGRAGNNNGVTVNQPQYTIVEVGGSAQLFLPSYINELSPTKVRFVSNDYVTVKSQYKTDCTIVGKKASSNVQVICRYSWETVDNGQKKSHDDVFVFYVRVIRVDPEGINLPQEMEVGWGKSFDLKPELYPEHAECGFSFKSDDTDIASISTKGRIEGLELGETVLTVTTTNGLTASTVLRVVIPQCEHIEFEQSVRTFDTVGDEMKLTPVIKPLHAEPNITWESSDPEVITVDQDGNCKAVAAGKAAIWIKTDNGKKYYKNYKIKEPKN